MPIPDEWAEQLGVEPGCWTSELGYEFVEAEPGRVRGATCVSSSCVTWVGGSGAEPQDWRALWLELRDQAPRRDMRAFHTRALLLGSVGLDTLRRALTDEFPGH